MEGSEGKERRWRKVRRRGCGGSERKERMWK